MTSTSPNTTPIKSKTLSIQQTRLRVKTEFELDNSVLDLSEAIHRFDSQLSSKSATSVRSKSLDNENRCGSERAMFSINTPEFINAHQDEPVNSIDEPELRSDAMHVFMQSIEIAAFTHMTQVSTTIYFFLYTIH